MKKACYGLMAFGIWMAMVLPAWGADRYPVVVEAQVKAVIAAERAGVLSRLRVDAGDRVKKGRVLATVFHEGLVLRKELYEANKKYFAFQVDNLTKLNEKGIATDQELEKARMDLAVNSKEIGMVQTEIDRSVIRAPFSGVVVNRQVQPHEWVTPGKPVVEMYNPAKLRVVADLPSNVGVNLKPGRTDSFYFPDLKSEVEGKLQVVVPRVDVRSNTIKVYWRVNRAQAKELMPGMKGILEIAAVD